MSNDYNSYIEHFTDDIATCLEIMGVQPIIFVGSGLSRRYFNAPNWEGLLIKMAEQCPEIKKEYAYFKQTSKNEINIGTAFADYYREWAWGEGRKEFAPELFGHAMPPEIYFKTKVAEYLSGITPIELESLAKSEYKTEIELLQKISPFSIITTNYDEFLKLLFPAFECIIGQNILKASYASSGEIYKIHGCVSRPESIVITEKDYNEFITKKKYLSAKLLTYFIEHPILFVGYNAEDPNIKSILSDIDEILATEGELIPNLYILEWNKNINEQSYPVSEKVISIDNVKSVRLKSIVANSFDWVFKAFGTYQAVENVRPELLRALLARTYQLVRHDIPRKTLEVDYKFLESALSDTDGLANLYGFAVQGNDPIAVNANYPYTLTDIGTALGYSNWNGAHQLLNRIQREKGINIKASDNKYYISIKTGKRSHGQKYSDELLELLKKVRDNQEYELNM